MATGQDLKKILLENAPNAKNALQLCKLANINRMTYYRYCNADTPFRKSLEKLMGTGVTNNEKIKQKEQALKIKHKVERAKKALSRKRPKTITVENQDRTPVVISLKPKYKKEGDNTKKHRKERDKKDEERFKDKPKPPSPVKGKPMPSYTEEDRLRLGFMICDLIERGSTVDNACQSIGLEKSTYYRWINVVSPLYIAELRERHTESKKVYQEVFEEEIVTIARDSMRRLIMERSVTSKTTIGEVDADGKVKPTHVRQKTEVREPNAHIVRFVVENLEESFKVPEKRSGQGASDGDIYLNKTMTEEQLEAEINKSKQKLGEL